MKLICPKCNNRCEQVQGIPKRISKIPVFYCIECDRYVDENGLWKRWGEKK